VALGYDPESGRAPTVLASGRGSVAEQILAIAFAQGIKVREDADLAEILAAVDVDSEIPLEALAAVAEILSYVYRANGRLRDADDSTGGNRPDGGVGHAPHLSLSAWRDLFGDANADPSPARPAPSAGSGTAPDAGEPPHD
jgi:flagellar biosynthesis protein